MKWEGGVQYSCIATCTPPFIGMDKKADEKTDALTAMLRLSEILNDSPTTVKVGDKSYKITALKMGTQVLISEETCKIQKHQEGNMVDLFNQFARSIPAVIRCIAYAILNDKDRIFKDYSTKEYSLEFRNLCEQIEWESDRGQWLSVLVEVINKIDLNFGMTITERMSMIRDSTMKKRIPER